MEPFGNLEKEAAPEHRRLHSTDYDPDKMLDALLDKLKLKNDAALADALGVAPPAISKIRHRKLAIGPAMLMRMHEASGLSIQELRQLMEPHPEQRSLPSWFQPAFRHLDNDHFEVVARLWREEPALRRLTEAMETLLPARRRLAACLRCHHTAIRCLGTTRDGVKRYGCSACGAEFVASEGTPFYAMRAGLYPRLFAVAVILWGPWTPFVARKMVGCCDFDQLTRYRERIQPLLDELAPTPLVSRPAYRLGFTPAQQGIRCLQCGGDAVVYVTRRHDPDNPRFRCTGCRHRFHLRALLQHPVPPPDDLRCPGCGSDQLSVKRLPATPGGRGTYACRACSHTLTAASQKAQLAQDSLQQLLHPPLAARQEDLSLPAWFQPAFGHLGQDDVDIAVRLWKEEPALRRLTRALEALQPDRWQPTACVHCNHTAIKYIGENPGGGKRYACSACDAWFTASEGTPFYNLNVSSHPRLFATAVALWGPWTPFFVRKIVGCNNNSVQSTGYRERLQPLLDALDPASLVSRPAYRFGFTPAQQGIRCLRCDGTDLTYAERRYPDNPRFRCMGCRITFALKVSRRKGIPPPADVRCPHCSGNRLTTQRSAAANNGRAAYRCKDCRRCFTSQQKTPVDDGMQSSPLCTASSSVAGEDAAMRVSNDRSMDPQAGGIRYDPDALLDALRDKLKLKNDAALARVLGMAPPSLSKIRHRQIAIGATILVRMHEESGLSIQELRRLMGDRRNRFGTRSAYFGPQDGSGAARGSPSPEDESVP